MTAVSAVPRRGPAQAARGLAGLALGDFRDRVPRPAYLVILAAAVGLGYLAVPEAGSRWVILNLGHYRGLYTSAYVGMATALAGAIWLTLGGFYVVRNAIARDVATGVGEVLAATPLRTAGYLAAKFLGNLLVLGSMLGVLAGTALVVQLARGESTAVDPVALAAPFLLIGVPMVALTAAAALLFEAIPPLRAGLGNVVWFVVWMAIALGGQSPRAPLGGIGVYPVAASLRRAMVAQGIDPAGQEFSLGLTYLDRPLRPFAWHGFEPGLGFVLGRLALVGVAAVLALLPALWFGRFDPARRAAPAPEPQAAPGPDGPAAALPEPPATAAAAYVLPVAWIWPVLIWSRLGTQRHEHGVEALLGAYPAARGRVLAEWAAGAAVAAAAGAVPLARMLLAGDRAGVAAWCAAVLFIPAFALALGTLSRTQRLFQIGYLVLWYGAVNGVPVVDYMGIVRDGAGLAGPPPGAIAALAVVLLAAALVTERVRRAGIAPGRR